jgi:hypothetical protein
MIVVGGHAASAHTALTGRLAYMGKEKGRRAARAILLPHEHADKANGLSGPHQRGGGGRCHGVDNNNIIMKLITKPSQQDNEAPRPHAEAAHQSRPSAGLKLGIVRLGRAGGKVIIYVLCINWVSRRQSISSYRSVLWNRICV